MISYGVTRLTGLIAAPAVVKADALMRIVAPRPAFYWRGIPVVVEDSLGNKFEAYTIYFRWERLSLTQAEWRMLNSGLLAPATAACHG